MATAAFFDQKTIDSALTARVLPTALGASVLGILSGVYGYLFHQPTGYLITALLSCFIAGAVWWVKSFRKTKYMYEYAQQYEEHLQELEREQLAGLSEDLEEMKVPDGIRQLNEFDEKIDVFQEILSKQFDPTEFAYKNYQLIARTVYINGIKNLAEAAMQLRSVQTIDLTAIDKDLKKLRATAGACTDLEKTRLEALVQRRALYDGAVNRVTSLLSQNEQLLTSLDAATTTLAGLRIDGKSSKTSAESAMLELKDLISTSQKFETLTTAS